MWVSTSAPMITPALRTAILTLSVSIASLVPLARGADARSYRELLLADKPAAYWRFDSIEECCTSSETDAALRANAGDRVSLAEAGPRPPMFPLFAEENTAADFSGYERDTHLRVKDSQDIGAKSVLRFDKGETITIEAWVQCGKLGDGRQPYVVGKGRTGLPGTTSENQNWAMRLRGEGGLACTGFLFHDRETPEIGRAHV